MKRWNRRGVAMGTLAAFAMLAGTWATVAEASMALAVSLQELVERADHVVVVRAVSSQSLRDAHGRIVTDVEVIVERSEKGPTQPGDSLVVRTLGGELDGITTRVVGAPVFEIDQRQVLFAVDARAGEHVYTLELSQGLMRVFERDGESWVHGGGAGLALRERAVRGGTKAVAHGQDRPLEGLLEEVRQLLAGTEP